jgi:hypothetical protein
MYLRCNRCGLREGGRLSWAGGQGSIPWMVYVGYVILTQSLLRMALLEEEGKSMGKAIHQLKLFVFSVIETVMAIQINIISSVLPSS